MADSDKTVKGKDKDYAQSFRSLLKSHGLNPSKDMTCLWCGQPTMHLVANNDRVRILCTKCKHSANLSETIATFNRNRHKTDNSNNAKIALFQSLDSFHVDNKNSIERNDKMKNDILPSNVEDNSAPLHSHDADANADADSDVDTDADADSNFKPVENFHQRKQNAIDAVKGNQFFNPDAIHPTLKWLDQWVPARNKIPQRLVGDHLENANGNDSKNWLSFADAAALAVKFNAQLGFVFTAANPMIHPVGIDIDDCVDDDGNLNKTASDLVNTFKDKAYIERSQSKLGLHIIFCDQDAPPIGTKANPYGVELYANNHFFVITGDILFAPPEDINAANFFNITLKQLDSKAHVSVDAFKNANIEDLRKYINKFRRNDTLSPDEIDQLDKKIIERIRKSKSADKFGKLFNLGDISDYVEVQKDKDGNITTRVDPSRADAALLSIIALKTRDPYQIARIFSMAPQSKDAPKVLGKRDKWKDREDYRIRSIAAALSFTDKIKLDSPFGNDAWVKEVKDRLHRSKNGTPVADAYNFFYVFQHDHNLKDLLRWNLFTGKIEVSRLPHWRKNFERDLPWQDFDDAALQNYIDRTYGLHGKDVFFRVVNEYARKNSFHPVQDFFHNLPDWDEKKRAETLFIDHLGAVDNPYNRAVARQWLLAAVARVFHPACKFDFCLTLQGKQGIGKSTLLSLLGGKWFGELNSIQGKDAVGDLQGLWIVELTEMQAAKRAENEQIKSFLSARIDRARLSYDRRTSEFPRQCVIAATTNDAEPLKDQTGGRRFWIIECKNKDFNLTLSKDDIAQIWAEVYHLYNQLFANGFDSALLDLPVDVKDAAVEVQAKHTDGSDIRGIINAFLDKPIPKYAFWKLLTRDERKEYFKNGGVVKLPFKRLPPAMQDKFFNTETTDDFGEKWLTIDSNIRTKDNWGFYFDTAHDGKRQKVSPIEILYELFDGERSKLNTRRIADLMRNLDGWQEKSWCINDDEYGRQKVGFIRVVTDQ